MGEPVSNIEVISVFYRIRRVSAQTGNVDVSHVARFLTHRPTNAEPRAAFSVLPLRGAKDGNRLRTQDGLHNGALISVTQHAHCTGWLLVRSIIEPAQGSVADFDSALSEWAVDAQSRASWRAAVAALYDAPAPIVQSEIVAPPASIDWSKMSRTITDDDDVGRVPLAVRRPSFWRRMLGFGLQR